MLKSSQPSKEEEETVLFFRFASVHEQGLTVQDLRWIRVMIIVIMMALFE